MSSLQNMPELQCYSPPRSAPPISSINGKPIARGNDTCVAPVVEVGQVLAASKSTPAEDRSSDWLVRRERSTAWNVRSMAATASGRRIMGTWWVLPPEQDSDGRSTGDFEAVRGKRMSSLDKYRALLTGLLTLHRNTDSGEVWRVSSKYEVLAVTSVRRAVCLRPDCSDLTAVDTTGRGACSATACEGEDEPQGGDDALTVVTHNPEGGGPPRPVSAVQHGLLGLGRAAMVQGGWLPRTAYGLTAHLRSCLFASPGRAPWKLETGETCSNWTLNGGAGPVADARPADWLARVAFVLCQEPVPRYLDAKRLCKGVPQQAPLEQKVTYDKEAFRTQSKSGRKRTIAHWYVQPARHEREAVPSCPLFFPSSPTANESLPTEPLWLAGTASREINAEAPEEADLVARLGRCTVPAPVDVDTAELRVFERTQRREAVSRVVETLTSGDFAVVDVPDNPFPRSEAFVTGMLVVITAIGALSFVPKQGDWKCRKDWARFLITTAVGACSLAAFGLLYWKERKGYRWMTSATYKTLDVAFANTTGDCVGLPETCSATVTGLAGSSVIMSETFAVVSTNGYKPLKILLLGVGAALLYVSIVVSVLVVYVRRGHKKAAAEAGSDNDGGDTLEAPPVLNGGGGAAKAAALDSSSSMSTSLP